MNNEKKFIKLTPFKMQVLQTFPFIDADFDAITNYELLCKVVEYLNTTVNNVNLLESDFKVLYDYVHDYFDNLDVQEEINNKLDQMVTDGTLPEIIGSYLNSKAVFGFDNVTSMKNSTNLINGSYARTLGYHSKNDGGSALYKIRLRTFDDVIDNASLILMQDETLVAEYINEDKGFINVNKFGLSNNLYMNDYWEKIYNYALSNNLYIYFPTATYNVKKVNISNDYIFTGKFISMKGENAKIVCDDSVDSNTDLFKFVGNANNYNQFIDGLEFTCLTNNYSKVRYFINFVFEYNTDIFYNLRITNNLFRKNSNYAIYTDGFGNGGFNNCQFSHNIVYGLFMKSLSFGDSNKIIGNSLYGSEEIQLNDYVINLVQTSGSSGCSISENNCSSGLGRLSGFLDLLLANNQIENTTQDNLDYVLKLETCRDVEIVASNFNAHSNNECNLIYSSGNDVHIKACSLFGYGKLITSPNHPIYVNGVRGSYNNTTFERLLPNSSCSGLVTMYNIADTSGDELYIDSNLQMHFFEQAEKSYTINPWIIKGNITAGDAITNIDGGVLHFNTNYSIKFTTMPKVPIILDVKY